MTTVVGNSRLDRGALLVIGAPDVILFQYNPDTLTRTLQAQAGGDVGGDRSEAMRLRGAPSESFRLEVEIDATDQLEGGDPTASRVGIHPQLAQLEMLLYPPSAMVVANTALLAAGTIEVVPPLAPLTLFVWGVQRILPVRLTEFTVTEEAHDSNLNPIRAKVALGLRVLSYNDLPITHPGYHLFLTHQVVKEAMAAVAAGSPRALR